MSRRRKLHKIRKLDGTICESPFLPECYEITSRGIVIEHIKTEVGRQESRRAFS